MSNTTAAATARTYAVLVSDLSDHSYSEHLVAATPATEAQVADLALYYEADRINADTLAMRQAMALDFDGRVISAGLYAEGTNPAFVTAVVELF